MSVIAEVKRVAISGRAAVLVARLRAHTDLPVAVGLGVRSRAQAAEATSYADRVTVGRVYVRPQPEALYGRAGVCAVADRAAEPATGTACAAGAWEVAR